MPPDTQRLRHIVAMHARHDAQLHQVVRRRGSQDAAIVEDACAHAWMKLLVAEHVDLNPPRWSALAWLTNCAVGRARALSAGAGRAGSGAGVPQQSPGRLRPQVSSSRGGGCGGMGSP
jgi:hypothetical protein